MRTSCSASRCAAKPSCAALFPVSRTAVEPGVQPLVEHALVQQYLQAPVLRLLPGGDLNAESRDQHGDQLFAELAGLDHRRVGVSEDHRFRRSAVTDQHGLVLE